MFANIIQACDRRFKTLRHGRECAQCTYSGFCPEDFRECEKCLELIHYPDRVPDGFPHRRYDCQNMADFYVCKYSGKYVSELIYAFERLADLQNRNHLKQAIDMVYSKMRRSAG